MGTPPQPPRLHTALVHEGTRGVAFHDHPFTELVCVEDGDISVSCQDLDYRAGAGRAFVLPPRHPHDQRNQGPWRTYCLLYAGGDHLLSSRSRVLDLRNDPLSRRWIADLVELTASGDATTGDGLLLTLLTRLGARDERDATAAAMPAPVTEALRYLERRLHHELSNEEVAEAAGVSVSHLGGLFRSHLGCGPLHHLQRLRLDRAAHMLRNPYLGLPEVAKACGYKDVNYFIRHFKRARGIPPAKWRKQALREHE